jgi:Spo0E like sporulation regulatory protein.
MDKVKINEMRVLLDSLIESRDIKGEKILEVSRELDKLILEFYQDIGIYARNNKNIYT